MKIFRMGFNLRVDEIIEGRESRESRERRERRKRREGGRAEI
jgi:hypothetical protein